MELRPARMETDLPGIARVVSAYESAPVTVEDVRRWFLYRSPGRLTHRLVAVDGQDGVVGYSGIVHESWTSAGHYFVWVGVDPSARGRGTGAALWQASLIYLVSQGAARLETEVRDDDPVGLAFAGRRGFALDRHIFESTLDLAAFDETPYLPGVAALEAQGLRFTSLAAFPDTPETRRKLYDLNRITGLDIPGADGYMSYPEFEERILSAAWFRREGQLLAIEGDAWVGFAAVQLNPENQGAYNAMTGVLPAYRGRKIAQALKILAVRYAREHGACRVRTHNDSHNAPILAVNRKMGYRPSPGKYFLLRELQKEAV